MLEFVAGMRAGPGQVRLVHGERGAKQALRKALMERAKQECADVDVTVAMDARDL